MKTVYKYLLRGPSVQFVPLPRGAKILSFQAQNDEPCIWVLVDTDEPTVDSTEIRLHGTGHDIGDLKNRRFIGTCQCFNGTLVLHAWVQE